MCTPEEQNHPILRYKHFFLGHFWFALIEFASFSPFIRVSSFLFSFFIRFKIVTNIAKKINSSNPLCLFLTITFLRFPWNPAVKEPWSENTYNAIQSCRVHFCAFSENLYVHTWNLQHQKTRAMVYKTVLKHSHSFMRRLENIKTKGILTCLLLMIACLKFLSLTYFSNFLSWERSVIHPSPIFYNRIALNITWVTPVKEVKNWWSHPIGRFSSKVTKQM